MKILCHVGYKLNNESYSGYFIIPLSCPMKGVVLNDYVHSFLSDHFSELNIDMNLFDDSTRYHYELEWFCILSEDIVEL